MEDRPVALVTGCSTGIGYETALLLAQEGWRVFASMRDLGKAGPLRKAAKDLPLTVLPLDVDDPSSVRKAVASVLRKAGRVDVLVNNAGWGAFGALEEFTDREVAAQFETNVLGLMRVTRAVLPAMRAQGSGRILHIGSLAGKMTFAGIALYCATKHAVEALTEGLRLELRPFGVEVSVVEPGNIKTPFKANRRKAQAFLSGRSAYRGVLQRVLDYGNRSSFLTPGPERVALKVLRTLRKKRLPCRVPVGLDAFWFPVVRWFLPSFLYEVLMTGLYRRFLEGSVTVPTGTPLSGTRRVALVTGANSGFGLETAKKLAAEGWKVYGTYRDAGKSKELLSLGREGVLTPLRLEVTQETSVRSALGTLARKEGRLDLLINNAGSVVAGFLEDLTDGELRAQFEVNVFGPLRVVRHAASLLKKARGLVINLGSISGRVVFPGIGAYAASKFALRSLNEGLRMELRPFGVGVCEIAPGTFATRVVQNTRFAQGAKQASSPYRTFVAQVEALATQEFKRAAPAAQVADLILQLARSGEPAPAILAGTDAKVMAFLKWLLPDTWFEWIFSRFFPWSRSPER